jgi:ribokinase
VASEQVDVVVVGSANLDVVLDVRDLPGPGQTVLAHGRTTGPGGKGLNQAVAAARSGARTCFVGAVGDDDAGGLLRSELDAAGVRTALRRSTGRTGTAYVVLDGRGENCIVVDPGANGEFDGLDEEQRRLLGRAAVVLCSLEVPVATVITALGATGGLRVLNAAPAEALPPALTDLVDVLVVNEAEALAVAGSSALAGAVEQLLERVPEVVVTLGADGVLLARRGHAEQRVAAVPARSVVDTTGAGDVLCGAYAAARATGADGLTAVRLGCAAASLSVERPGAARSAPTLAEARHRLEEADRPAPAG